LCGHGITWIVDSQQTTNDNGVGLIISRSEVVHLVWSEPFNQDWSIKTQDERSALEVAKQRRVERGEQCGSQQVARTMLTDGLPSEAIAQYNGLATEEVVAIQKDASGAR
jgi:hypothetical protein